MYYSLAERVGFEPTVPLGITSFKTSSLNRSDTSPLDCIKQLYYYTIKSRFCQEKTANFFGQFQKVLVFLMEKEKNTGKKLDACVEKDKRKIQRFCMLKRKGRCIPRPSLK